jgi:hypothetical protein
MRKIVQSLLSTIFCLFFLLTGKTQNITLNTQAQVDAFNATVVTGTITITGPTITNLNGLSELTKCQKLIILSNANLTSIIGLANLEEVESTLTIGGNTILTNLAGFSSLASVGEFITISNNPALTNLDGLFSLTHVGSLFGKFTIDNNDALTNVDGLSAVTFLPGLAITNNAALTDLDGLANLESIGFSGLVIENNSALSNIDGLSKMGTTGDLKIISNPSLVNVDGLSSVTGLNNIDARHNLEIKNNSSLQNIDGLSSFVGVTDGDLVIQNNDALTNIDALSKLKLVGEVLIISDNLLLANVDGLSHLEAVGGMTIDHNAALTNLDGLSALQTVIRQLSIQFNPNLTDFCGLYNLFHTGEIGGAITIKNNGANTLTVTPHASITVNADQGLCSATVSNLLFSATVEGCLGEITGGHSDLPADNIFSVGTTNILWTATDAAGNTATGIQTVTVVDNQPPVIVSWPSDVTVSCTADVPTANDNSITATDNCPNVTITHLADVISNQTCANRFTVTRTYIATDHVGNTATKSQVIVVNDNQPPTITGLSTTQSSLWPADHTMRDITVNYTVRDNCVTDPPFSLSISSNEPVNGTADGDTDPDWEILDNHHIRLRAERAANGTGRIYTITITVNDGCNASVITTTQVMVVHNITGPVTGHPFKLGSTVDFAGEFWDKLGNKHSAKWLIDNTSVKGTVTEPAANKNGKVVGSYKFNSAGVYKLQMNITDQTGVTSYANTNGDLEEIVVIYDPNGGYTYGGGWFNSPAGALVSDPSATGKASYGFTVNYFKNSTYPKGETQFELKVGNFEFNALTFDYLVIAGAKAQFRGTGKITGDQSGVGFIMTVIDGTLDGTGIDKVRIKIYNKNTGQVIYDNQPGASDVVNPIAVVGSNSDVVISGAVSNNLRANTETEMVIEAIPGLDINANPNPSSHNFNLSVRSDNIKSPIVMQVVDIYGRLIEVRNVNSNSIVRIGDSYRPGVYIVKIIQDKIQKQIKLVKLSD